MSDKQEPCRYCGMEIRPLDRHAHSMTPDKDAERTGSIMVTCILNRYYTVVPDGGK